MAVPSELTEYIKKQLQAGFALDEIKSALESEGWPKDQIYESLGMVFETSGAPMSGKPPFFGIIISIAAGFLIFKDVLFGPLSELINIYFLPFLQDFNFLGLEGGNLTLLNAILGLGMVLGAIVAYRMNEMIGGLAVIILSVLFLLSTGMIPVFAVGILGGVILMLGR